MRGPGFIRVHWFIYRVVFFLTGRSAVMFIRHDSFSGQSLNYFWSGQQQGYYFFDQAVNTWFTHYMLVVDLLIAV